MRIRSGGAQTQVHEIPQFDNNIHNNSFNISLSTSSSSHAGACTPTQVITPSTLNLHSEMIYKANPTPGML